jgi:protein involved in polysaccharide export with SLBB domain
MRKIQLKRGSNVSSEFDLYDLLLKGDKSKDVMLQPGDVVYVPEVGPQLAIAGSVKNPGIYEIKGEKTVGEMIQMAGGLSALADTTRAVLERVRDHSVRESLDIRLDAAGLAIPVADGDLLHVATVSPQFDNTVTLRGNVANPGRFTWHAGMRLHDVIPNKDVLVTKDYWKHRNVLGFEPQSEAVPAQPEMEAQRKATATEIRPAVPDINWSYAVIERQNPRDLSMELIPFHPGKLVLENSDAENLELRRGDVITILSQADMRVASLQQTRFVRLEGEFEAAGVYAVKPGETLGQLIERAGGLTTEAYLYGAEFTRESTRIEQQRHLDQFVQEMEQDIEHTASNALTGAITNDESALLATRLSSERALVARMRSLKATGRIVLSQVPGSNDLSKFKDLQLEDGDRFLVPAKPSTVNVLGSVYNQNAFVHRPGERIADYLQQAGGPTRNGDKGKIFVIRADGSVTPKTGAGMFSHTFESGTLNPGDSIVVPEAILRTTFLRGVRDWSSVIAQFALGAAAVNVLR